MKKFGNYNDFKTFVESINIYTQSTVNYFKQFQNSDYVVESTCTGGLSGGSCWGREPEHFEGEEPTYDIFYKLAANIFDTESEDEVKKRTSEIEWMV